MFFSLKTQPYNFGFIHITKILNSVQNFNTKNTKKSLVYFLNTKDTKILSSAHNFDTKDTKKSLVFFLNTKDTKILSSAHIFDTKDTKKPWYSF